MKVERIRATEKPEELVCTAARNDYRSEGVISHSFEELVEDVEVDAHIADELAEERTTIERPEEPEDLPIHVLTEAKKRSLLKHLMRSGHWGVFEHPQATVAIEGVTRVSMAQITRHRHFSFDVMSLRYVNADVEEGESLSDRFDTPPEDADEEIEDLWFSSITESLNAYEKLIDKGVSKEEARKVLGMGTKVNIVMSGSARAWMHLLNIRGKGNVQGEAREIADNLMREMKDWMPYTFERYDEMLPLKLNP